MNAMDNDEYTRGYETGFQAGINQALQIMEAVRNKPMTISAYASNRVFDGKRPIHGPRLMRLLAWWRTHIKRSDAK